MNNVAFFVYFHSDMKAKKKQKPMFILASRSPRRRLLLKQIGLRFTVHPSSVAERVIPGESPAHNVRRLALEKAIDVARRSREGTVVGADTIVVLGKRILGKPRNRKDARRMLSLLSGRWHVVYTGFALVDTATGRSFADVVRTRVLFRRIAPVEMAKYVASGSPLDKAGAYGIQDDYGAAFVEEVRGCFYNVVGFPLSNFLVSVSEFLQTPIDRLIGR